MGVPVHWEVLTNQVVVGKATPVVRGHNGHCDKGSRKEVLAAESRDAVSEHWRTFPGAHETETIRKEVHQERKGT